MVFAIFNSLSFCISWSSLDFLLGLETQILGLANHSHLFFMVVALALGSDKQLGVHCL